MSDHKQKVLFVASVASHINAFHRPYLKWFYDHGYEVHVACNGDFEDPHVFKTWRIDFERSPFSLSHFASYRQLKKVINDNDFALISCHTPMASVLTRVASLSARKNGAKVIYTAHGFHFFKGSSRWSWLTYYPVEILLTRFTDAIICINKEDYNLINKKGSKVSSYHLVPGIGVDSKRFKKVPENQRQELRYSMGLSSNSFVVVYAAEFIDRKNHKLIIDSILRLSSDKKNIVLLFAGKGALLEEMKTYVKSLGLKDCIRFLGFVNEIEKLYQVSDLAVSSSKQEGLGLNLVEAMMCGTPVIATVDRGHKTIVEHGYNGLLVPQNDSKAFSEAIAKVYSDIELRSKLAENAVKKSAEFELTRSLEAHSHVYEQYC